MIWGESSINKAIEFTSMIKSDIKWHDERSVDKHEHVNSVPDSLQQRIGINDWKSN